jgi:hypothetical protein
MTSDVANDVANDVAMAGATIRKRSRRAAPDKPSPAPGIGTTPRYAKNPCTNDKRSDNAVDYGSNKVKISLSSPESRSADAEFLSD